MYTQLTQFAQNVMYRALLAVFCALSLAPVAVAESVQNLYFFSTEGCPHCAAEKSFLDQLVIDNPDVVIHEHSVSTTKGREILADVATIAPEPIRGVPLTVIGETFIVGYDTDATTGERIISALERVADDTEQDLLGLYFAGEDITSILEKLQTSDKNDEKADEQSVCDLEDGACDVSFTDDEPETSISLPLLGTVEASSFSLPVLTVLIAFLDGFNPCAMWVLIFLITLLLGMKDTRRMWILGTAFIMASGAVYFLLLGAWLNLFLFIGFLRWIQIIIGVVALGTAGWYLYDGITNPHGECKIDSPLKRKKTIDKLKAFVHNQNIWLALVGIIVLAFAVNLIEAVCSAGLPAVYTQVLAMNDLSSLQYYGYLFLYVLIFMIDDIFIFSVAMLTLRHTTISTKYARWSHIIGGVILFLIGVLLLFKPSWLLLG